MSQGCELPFADPLWDFGTSFTSTCSGNGVCAGDFVCVCEDGWTGRSDWVNAEGFDCQINERAIIVIYALLLVVQVFVVVRSVPYLKARYASFKELQEAKKRRGLKYRLTDNNGALSMVLWHVVGVPSTIGLCLLRIFKDDERVGITYGASVLYSLTRFAFYLCYTLFQPALLDAVSEGKSEIQVFVKFQRRVIQFVFLLQCVVCILPLIAVDSQDVAQELYLVATGVSMLSSIILGANARYIMKHVSETLKKSYEVSKQEKTMVMHDKLVEVQKVPTKQAMLLTPIFAAFFIWPYLWTKHDYYIAFIFMMFAVAGLTVAKTSLTQSENSSIMASSGTVSGSGGAAPKLPLSPASESLQEGVGSQEVRSFWQQKQEYETKMETTDEEVEGYV